MPGHIKPWFDNHVYWDADLIRRWSGQDVDLTRPLPPDLIMAAGQADPEIAKAAGPYQAMLAPPSSLDAVQARARDIYAAGWRPPAPVGPTRDELAALVTTAASSRGHRAQDAALPATAALQQVCCRSDARRRAARLSCTQWHAVTGTGEYPFLARMGASADERATAAAQPMRQQPQPEMADLTIRKRSHQIG